MPICFVFLFVFAIYKTYTDNGQTVKEYNECLAMARIDWEDGILRDAIGYYERAINLKPSLELYIEVVDFYKDTNRQALPDWCERMISKYPYEAEGYEILMQYFYENQDYIECFKLYNKFLKRKIKDGSKEIDRIVENIQYTYFLQGGFLAVSDYSNGYCAVMTEEGGWGYVDQIGSLRIRGNYLKAGCFLEEKAPIIDANGSAYYIDKDGYKKAIYKGSDTLYELGMYYEGLMQYSNGQSWGYFDTSMSKETDRETTSLKGFDEVTLMQNGQAAVYRENKWYFINRKGERLTDKNYEDVIRDERGVAIANNRMFVMKNGSYHMIDGTEKLISESTYEDARLFVDNSYAAVKVNGRWGFVDVNGQQVIEPIYEDARSFCCGYAAVRKDGKWGYIDTSGNFVIEAIFDDARDFNSSMCAFVSTNGIWSLLRFYKYSY